MNLITLCETNCLTLSHLGDLIHSQSVGGGFRPPLRNFAFLDPNQTKFGVLIVPHKKKKT